MKELVSVIIPTYNREKLLKRCIKSVLNQSYENFEIVVVDNYSDDDTANLIHDINSDRIRFFQINNEGVIAKSRNFGIKKAKGKYVAFLDSDDWWDKHKLKLCLNYMSDYDFVYHNMKQVQGDKEKNLRMRSINKPYFDDLIINGNAIMTSSVVTKKEVLINANLFNESEIYRGWEDYELWLKIAKNDYCFMRLNSFLGYYHVGDDNFDNPNQALKNISLIDRHVIKKLDKRYSNIWWLNYARGRIYSNMGKYKDSNFYLKNTMKKNNIPFIIYLKIYYTLVLNFLKSNKFI
jgi:glycosyltransferase involved in cell wall biosynthesis